MDLRQLVSRRLEAGRSETVPQARIVIGPIGVGKTTYRRTELVTGFVHIDSADIFHELSAGDATLDFPDAFQEIESIGREITRAALEQRLNIVMETPGHEAARMIELIDSLRAIGYEVQVVALDADRETCEFRHANRGDSVSSYWAAPIHTWWVVSECRALVTK